MQGNDKKPVLPPKKLWAFFDRSGRESTDKKLKDWPSQAA
jgi:hypothetical protein